jgi:hypothetical protein
MDQEKISFLHINLKMGCLVFTKSLENQGFLTFQRGFEPPTYSLGNVPLPYRHIHLLYSEVKT